MMKNRHSLLLFLLLYSCTLWQACGTLGGMETIRLRASEADIKAHVDSFFKKYPQYQIPAKWKHLNDWEARGHEFLNGQVFYFNESPEEMYFVSFVSEENSRSKITIIDASVRAVSRGNAIWLKEENLKNVEIQRIQTRFRTEIINKIGCPVL